MLVCDVHLLTQDTNNCPISPQAKSFKFFNDIPHFGSGVEQESPAAGVRNEKKTPALILVVEVEWLESKISESTQMSKYNSGAV